MEHVDKKAVNTPSGLGSAFDAQSEMEGAAPKQMRAMTPPAWDAPVQRKTSASPAGGGLPVDLQGGIESMSGIAMDDVKVHYNSDKPAQMQAHAYAQGTDIHLAPGQEQHLPHEAWHVVQQKQGRVQATTQLKGAGINDDAGLEREADVMGAKAMAGGVGEGAVQRMEAAGTEGALQRKAVGEGVVQRVISLEGKAYADTSVMGLDPSVEAAWKKQVRNQLKLELAPITPANFAAMYELASPLDPTICAMLQGPSTIHEPYGDYQLKDPEQFPYIEKKLFLNPSDCKVGDDDLGGRAFDSKKACVLQSLISAGVKHPQLPDGANDADWHQQVFVVDKIRYDEDPIMAMLYSQLGLDLIHNTSCPWSQINLEEGLYVFAMNGHNFCVNATEASDGSIKYEVREDPKNPVVQQYQPDLKIKYIWKV